MSEYKIVVPRNPYVRQALRYLGGDVCPGEMDFWRESTDEPNAAEMVKAYEQIADAIDALGLDDEQ